MIKRLQRRDLPIDTVELTRYLIGKVLVREVRGVRTSGRIVEAEAYPVGDPAGHSFRGETKRTAALFRARGYAHVYFIYGMYYCMNVSSERAGVGAGILVRSLEPVEGIEVMKRRRGVSSLRDLARGPGLLTLAMAIDRREDGVDLCAEGPLWLGRDRYRPELAVTTRVGLSREQNKPWRFYDANKRLFVSRAPRAPKDSA